MDAMQNIGMEIAYCFVLVKFSIEGDGQMQRVDRLIRLKECGVIAVVRGASKIEAIESVKAVQAGGINGIELTFTVPQAEEVIKELVALFEGKSEVIIGAGTVLDATTARVAIMAGAEYIVSPCFDKETAEICNLYQIPYLPGCLTISEMKMALKAGVDIVKLFPGSAFGPSILSNYKAPMPQLNIMPTGGVSLDNMNEWLDAGAVAVGVGGNLFVGAATGDYNRVTETAKAYMQRYRELKTS
jgi:2-dehydro-3-deoxyphosphogluconate aldolase/(4S)-4-hydroxy-2-oxoglutarate aldolase